MEKIQNIFHTKETFSYAISKTLERMAYYGLRSLIVLYMIGEVLKMPNEDALEVYGLFTASLVFSQIIGAILGDLVIGNRKAIIFGMLIQALGAFSLCIPSINGLYIGLFFIVLGGGLYSPNIISSFGKLYLNKTKLLDAGFTFFYLAINLGAFFGTVTIGYIGTKIGWNAGFIIAGIIMLLSIIPILFTKEKEIETESENNPITNQRIINVSIVFVLVGIFWAIYEISYIRIFDLEIKLSEISTLDLPRSLWTSLNSMFTLPLSIIAIVLWSHFYSSQFFKLIVGFVFGAISFGILFLIPEIPNEKHTIIYIISLLFLGISEIHISPVINSVLTQYTNPKYLAILISLAFIPTRLFALIVAQFNAYLYEYPIVAMLIGMTAMTILSIGLIIYNRIKTNPLQ